MTTTSQKEISARFAADGFVFPLRGISAAQAANYREAFDVLKPSIDASDIGRGGQLNQVHAVLSFVNDIVRNERILDAVEAVLGPNILVWGSTFFIKEPRTAGFVSWHQDLRYWGLRDEDAMVSAWLALGPVTRSNGCMQFIAGSHKQGLLRHVDKHDADNFLYRGQEVDVDVDQSGVTHVELEAGEFSLHHGHLLHASPANKSDERRWGLTINYIAPHNRQIVADHDFAMLVRGEDCYGHFVPVPEPEGDLHPAALRRHAKILAAKDLATFDGAAAPG